MIQAEPKNIDVTPERLLIDWSDIGRREYAASFLRGMCQCANCVSEVTGDVLINRQAVSPDIKITRAEPMGNYAVSLAFSDRHSTGIYTFTFLKSLQK